MLKKITSIILLITSFFAIVLSVSEGMDYFSFEDIVITDVNRSTLVQEIGQSLSVHYLQKNELTTKTEYSGIIWGIKRRPMIALPVKLSSKDCVNNITIIFLVDTGLPVTTLSKQAIDLLYSDCNKQEFNRDHWVFINGKKANVIETSQQHLNLNIIGADFFVVNNIKLTFNYRKMGKRDFKMEFGAFEDNQLAKES